MTGYGKNDDGFRVHKRSLEPETMALGTDRTPIDRFFVCNVCLLYTSDAADE